MLHRSYLNRRHLICWGFFSEVVVQGEIMSSFITSFFSYVYSGFDVTLQIFHSSPDCMARFVVAYRVPLVVVHEQYKHMTQGIVDSL